MMLVITSILFLVPFISGLDIVVHKTGNGGRGALKSTFFNSDNEIHPRFEDNNQCVSSENSKGAEVGVSACDDADLVQSWNYNSQTNQIWVYNADADKNFCWTISGKLKKLKRKTLGIKLVECEAADSEYELIHKQQFHFDMKTTHLYLDYENGQIKNNCVVFDRNNNGNVFVQKCANSNFGSYIMGETVCDPTEQCCEDMLGVRGGLYRGCQVETIHGYTCKSWTGELFTYSNGDISNYYVTPDSHPNEGIDGGHNYCRNPDGDAGGIWCFTDQSQTLNGIDCGEQSGNCPTWEYCDALE